MAINMSYCRFENTYKALDECLDALSESGLDSLSKTERRFAEDLANLCERFSADYDELIGG